MNKLIITDINYSAGTLIVSVEFHPIGNDFNFKEIHDLIEEYGAVNEVVFKDYVSDLNQVYEVASMFRSYKPDLNICLMTDRSDLDCLEISNILRPIPFNRLIMDESIYKVKNDKLVKVSR